MGIASYWGLAAALMLSGAVPSLKSQPSGQGRARAAAVVTREVSYLGIGVENVDSERARALKLKDEGGAYITSVTPDSPASKAGLQQGDVVLEFNGQRVENQGELVQMVRDTPAGKQVKITVWRAGAPLTVWATVASHKVMESEDGNWSVPMPPMGNLPSLPPGFRMPAIDIPRMITVMQNPALGVEGESLGQEPQFAEFFGVKDGVLVKAVRKGSAAERAGIKAGDVIARIGDARIANWRDLATAMRYVAPGRSIAVTVIRNKREVPFTVTIE